MNSLVPVSWKDSAAALRENVLGIFDCWLPWQSPVQAECGDIWDSAKARRVKISVN